MSSAWNKSQYFSTMMRQKLRVLVDMDGVLCDFEDGFLRRFVEKFPKDPIVPLKDRRTFYLDDQYSKFGPEFQVSV